MDLALPGVYVEANWGRWVARCPRQWCTNAVQVWTGDAAFACSGAGGCGWTADLVWPPDPDAIELLLTMRPVPRTRNWLPGESLEDLIAENALHGVLAPALEGLTGSTTLALIADGRLAGGLLQRELTGAARPRIGA